MRELLEFQGQNKFLWAPLLMAAGAALYFGFAYEPHVPFAIGWAILCFIVAVFRTPIFLRAAALFAFGFLYSVAYTNIVSAPVMTRAVLRDTVITATVTDIDYTADKTRIYLRTAADKIGAGRGAANVRLSVAGDAALPNIGDIVRVRANLYRPGGADAPGAFDYARWAYFNDLTATGYISEMETVAHGRGGFAGLRNAAHRRADSFLSDALIFGYKNMLDADVRGVWMATGVGHVWSISGFHITLISTWLFFIFFMIFRCVPYVTRRVPARIPATVCAWMGLTFYLFLSGAGIATIRAFLMASLIFAALLMGRMAASLRNVAIAFCAIFLINPHYVMQAGFQLSFAAIFGLVWFWGAFANLPANKIVRVIYVAVMTSVVATIFTMPFIAAHFGTIPIYGVMGNLIFLPVFSLVIMPLTAVGTVLAMFDLHAVLELATGAYNFIFVIARMFANLPGATVSAPQISVVAITMFVLGGASLMFVRPVKLRINYIAAGVFVALGIMTVVLTPRPVFYSTADTELVAFRENEKLEFNKSRASNHFFTFSTWKQMNGEAANTPNPRRNATKGVYRFNTPKFNLVYIQKYVPLAANIVEMCRDESLDYIVSYFRVDAPRCHARILHGGFVIYGNGRVRFINLNRRWHRSRN